MTDLPLPPNSPDAEAAALGSILLDAGVLGECKLVPGDFYATANQKLFQAIMETHQETGGVDPVFLGEMLGDDATKLMADCLHAVASPAQFPHYAALVKEKAGLRKVLQTCREVTQAVHDGEVLQDVLGKVQEVAFQAGLDASDAPLSTPQIIDEVLAGMLGEKHADWSTGIASLDAMIGGINRKELITIAGESGHGKSATAMSIALPALEAGARVMFADYEMGPHITLSRLISQYTEVPITEVVQHNLSPVNVTKMTDGGAAAKGWNILHLQNPSLLEIHARARQWKADIVIYDYIQNAFDSEKRKDENEASAITRVMASMKRLALQSNLAVIAVSQVIKNVGEGRPRKADMKGSGGIFDASDKVIFAYWPHKKGKECQDTTFVLGVDKQKNGPTGVLVCGVKPWCIRVVEPIARPPQGEVDEVTK